jgi:CopG family transcriptional regulator, nickel-responsive regulator
MLRVSRRTNERPAVVQDRVFDFLQAQDVGGFPCPTGAHESLTGSSRNATQEPYGLIAREDSTMEKVTRFGVSLDPDLLKSLDEFRRKRKFANRSQAIRFIVEDALAGEAVRDNKDVCGALVLIYDHHKADFMGQFLAIQHDYHEQILSSQHIHIDHDNCLETISLRGRSSLLREVADRLLSLKGIKHGKLVLTAL